MDDYDEEVDESTQKLDKDELEQLMLEEAIKPKPYILSSRKNPRFYWDVLIIIFAIQNAITLPLEIAFAEKLNGGTVLAVLEWLTMFVFFMDILVGFNTSYINVASGDEIYGHKMIAYNYVFKGTFMIDILSTFPLDKIFGNIVSETALIILKILGMLKMQRIRRISKIIGQLNQTQETKAFFKVAQMVALLILYIHVLACILWFTFNTDKKWIP